MYEEGRRVGEGRREAGEGRGTSMPDALFPKISASTHVTFVPLPRNTIPPAAMWYTLDLTIFASDPSLATMPVCIPWISLSDIVH